jgi:hypothetical protein
LEVGASTFRVEVGGGTAIIGVTVGVLAAVAEDGTLVCVGTAEAVGATGVAGGSQAAIKVEKTIKVTIFTKDLDMSFSPNRPVAPNLTQV